MMAPRILLNQAEIGFDNLVAGGFIEKFQPIIVDLGDELGLIGFGEGAALSY
jgi:hypothetical protein